MDAKNHGEYMLLDAYRVLDLTNHRGQLCGKILADLGADVVKIEPPHGDPSRKIGPFLDDEEHIEKSLHWFAYNTSKRSVTLDIESPDGRTALLKLAKDARFIIESFDPGYLEALGLSFESFRKINPSIIMVSISPFGQTGPYAHFKDSDLINMGMGGQMTLCGDTDRSPLRFTAEQSYPLGAIYGAMAALAAHFYREKTGIGQYIDVSIQESIFQSARSTRIYWDIQRFLEQREGSRMARGTISFRNFWMCKDGIICWRLFVANLGKWTQALVDWMQEQGKAAYLVNVKWEELDMATCSQEEIDRYEAPFEDFFLQHTREDLFNESLKREFVLFPLNTTEDLLNNKQLNARDFWMEVECPEFGKKVKYPASPFRIKDMPYIPKRPPRLGEHNQTIFEETSENFERPDPLLKTHPIHMKPSPPLDGIHILDFTWVIAGPKATKYLANLGATVVRVESEQRLDFLRSYPPFPDGISGINRSATFAHLNDGKYGIVLNTKHPESKAVLKKLVQWADVVVENFTPGIMDRMGLAYKDLCDIKSDIIMLQASLFGQTGPFAHQSGLGTMLQAYAGFSNLIGWPDRMPVGTAAPYTDFPSAGFIAIGILAALDYRRRTGKGTCIDISQFEASQQMLLPALLDYTANGRVWKAMGNRHPQICPHGAYPCIGDDRWCLISVFDEKQWSNFKAAMGNPQWAEQKKFSILHSRKTWEDELDTHIAAWTQAYSPEDIIKRLQAVNVPAGMVKNGKDIHEDPQLNHRGHLVHLEHQEMGKICYDMPPFRFSHSPIQMNVPSPCLGEHTEMVCREFLGMNDEVFFELLSAGVFE